MRELRRQGYLSLSDFSEGVADGWEKIEKIAALHKNVVFYHRHTKNQLMKFTSPYFYLHFRGDETPILNTCRAHGFQVVVKNAEAGLIGIHRSSELDFSVETDTLER